jgi:DNA-directed RNA polymerase subunit beta
MRWKRPTEATARGARGQGRDAGAGEIRAWTEEILIFYGQVVFTARQGLGAAVRPDAFRGMKLLEPLVDADTGEGGGRGRRQADRPQARKIAEKTKEVLVGRADLLGRYRGRGLVNEETGEIYAEAGEELAEARCGAGRAGIDQLPTLAVDQATARGSATRWRSTRTQTATTR